MDKNLVIQLRELTSAGMSDCLKALEEANGDLQAAAEILRKKGTIKMAKRAERETKEGLVKNAISADAKTGYMLEVNAETDFVVHSDKFQEFAQQAFDILIANSIENRDGLLQADFGGKPLQQAMEELSAIFGEKLEIKNCAVLKGDHVAAYAHANNKIGALISLSLPELKAEAKNDLENLAKEIAMQVTALDPQYITPADVPAEIKNKEEEIYQAELKVQNKPEAMWPKIIEGKMNKFYSENCLIKQASIREETVTVEQLIKDFNDKYQMMAAVEKIVRFKI